MIRTSNQAVHHGNIVADRALMKLGLGNYADEFLRLYEYTVEESFRFRRPLVIDLLNKRATLQSKLQWNSSLQRAFRLLMDCHDTTSEGGWNRFRSSSTSPEARSWALIQEMKENKGPIYGESGQGSRAI